MRKDPWPSCPEPDALFGHAVLVVSPIEPSGWSVTRDPFGSITYIAPRRRNARACVAALISFFEGEVRRFYGDRGWRQPHINKVARKWKNEFLLWLWEVRDGA